VPGNCGAPAAMGVAKGLSEIKGCAGLRRIYLTLWSLAPGREWMVVRRRADEHLQ